MTSFNVTIGVVKEKDEYEQILNTPNKGDMLWNMYSGQFAVVTLLRELKSRLCPFYSDNFFRLAIFPFARRQCMVLWADFLFQADFNGKYKTSWFSTTLPDGLHGELDHGVLDLSCGVEGDHGHVTALRHHIPEQHLGYTGWCNCGCCLPMLI